MKLENERIKKEAKATPEQVAEVIKKVVPNEEKVEIHNEKLGQKIYVGPNIPGLPKYTVVEAIEVPHVQNIIKECAAVEKLFVPIIEMAETESRAMIKGTLENRFFKKIIDHINSKRKGGN